MKKILSMILCLVMLASLALMANAEALNMGDGCKTKVDIKKADSSYVIKDGIIGNYEYVEIPINRDPNTSDLLLSWNDSENPNNPLFDLCVEFLKDIHYYISWDEVNGLNMAIKATLLETPWSNTPQPDDSYFSGIPGDEFLFQFGAMFCVEADDEIIIYRGLGYNTVAGTALTGHYGKHGHTGSFNLSEGKNFAVDVNPTTKEVIYEISYPLASILVANEINGNAPSEGTKIEFNMSATGGSLGEYGEGSKTYCVSLGDGGFMSSRAAGRSLSPAIGYFVSDAIPSGAPVVTTQPNVTTEPQTEIVTSYVPVTTVDEKGNVVEVTDAEGNKVTDVVSEVVTVAPTTTTPGANTHSPTTGDPMIIAAVVAAISACGIVVAKKRK